MAYRRTAITLISLFLASAQAHASSDQSFETFEDRDVGTQDMGIPNPELFSTFLTGGTVVLTTPEHPAHSGLHVYGGTSITLVTADEFLFSWPGVGAWVSGPDTIWLQAYEYDTDETPDIPLTPVELSGGVLNSYLSIGSLDHPRYITKATFSSDSYFTLDDLTLGIEGVGPGIPEPASWAMLVSGFGIVGGAMRVRRRAAAAIV